MERNGTERNDTVREWPNKSASWNYVERYGTERLYLLSRRSMRRTGSGSRFIEISVLAVKYGGADAPPILPPLSLGNAELSADSLVIQFERRSGQWRVTLSCITTLRT
jgi:hypothetical protein